MRRICLVLVAALSVLALSTGRVEGRQAGFPDKAKARILVSQDEQRMFIYEEDRLVMTLPVSTGWPGLRKSTTPAWSGRIGPYWGTFSSFGTTQDDGYWLFTDRFDDGSWNGDILIHGAPYVLGANDQKEYHPENIGRVPASNGCIQLRPVDADWFHEWNPIGVPITIAPWTKGILDYPKLGFGAQLAAVVQNAPSPETAVVKR